MFDRVSLPLPFSLLGRLTRSDGRHTHSAPLPISLAIALAVTAGLAAAPTAPVNATDTGGANEPSIQYQEAMSHAVLQYSFTPGHRDRSLPAAPR